jgi:DNA-binding response OmpR family regulator
MFDDSPAHDPHAAPAGARRLLLFVGPDLQPGDELGAVLARSGWRCLWLAGSEPALRAAAHARFDALVVQAESAGGPPARQVELLRQTLGCPVLVVAQAADEVDEIIALELGADAYLTGALAPRRLRAHLQALLRRGDERAAAAAPATQTLALGRWTLDSEQQSLLGADRRVALTELQCLLLHSLGTALARVVPREVLVAALGPGRGLHARSVDVYVARLRRRLREQHVDDLVIEGVRGRGYTLSLQADARTRAALGAWSPRSGSQPAAWVSSPE